MTGTPDALGIPFPSTPEVERIWAWQEPKLLRFRWGGLGIPLRVGDGLFVDGRPRVRYLVVKIEPPRGYGTRWKIWHLRIPGWAPNPAFMRGFSWDKRR